MHSIAKKRADERRQTNRGEHYSLILHDRGVPAMADEYAKRASVNDIFETSRNGGDWCYVAVSNTQHRMAILNRQAAILAIRRRI